MMGKASSRKSGPESAHASNVHERIQTEAKRTRETGALGLAFDDKYPELTALLRAGRAAVGETVPIKFIYEGRPYWLRVCIGAALLEVFDKPGTGTPLTRTITGSSDRFGHSPAH